MIFGCRSPEVSEFVQWIYDQLSPTVNRGLEAMWQMHTSGDAAMGGVMVSAAFGGAITVGIVQQGLESR
jgi:hypothetical protein